MLVEERGEKSRDIVDFLDPAMPEATMNFYVMKANKFNFF